MEDDAHPGAGGVVEGGGEELGHGAGQGAHLVQDRGGDALQPGDSVGVQVQQDGGLGGGVAGAFGLVEGEWQGRAGVDQAWAGGPGELLGPVEVAEGHVVEAAAALGQGRAAQGGEDPGGHGVDAADADVPFGLAGLASDDEGVDHEQARQAPAAAGAQAVQVCGHEA